MAEAEPKKVVSKASESWERVAKQVKTFFDAEKSEFEGLQKVSLLKKLEEKAGEWFLKNYMKDVENKEQFINATCKSNFSGIEDFSEEYYKYLELADIKQDHSRNAMELALKELDHGFSKFDRTLMEGSAVISRAYGPYYMKWSKSISDKAINDYIEKNGKPAADSDLCSHYTGLILDGDNLKCVSYGDFYKVELQPIIAAMNDLIAKLEALGGDDHGFIAFFKQYVITFEESDISKLEKLNADLDRKWMDIQYWIDIVHDIETGYGDPMRVKAIPDFSLRFQDSEYEEENKKMVVIKGHMVDYFRNRDTEIGNKGLTALSSTCSAIFYIPFQCGMSLHFRFSGQCIPNRPQVKEEKGIKIYFDPVSKADRNLQVMKLVPKVFENAEELCKCCNAADELTYMTNSHEVGHAIYGLKTIGVEGVLGTELEEPRAELTSCHTLKLLKDVGMVNDEEMADHLQRFMLSDLRRFDMWDSSSTYPYTISAINMFRTYIKTGYVSFNEDKSKLRLDRSKAYASLQELSALFERVLDLEDKRDVQGLHGVHEMMKKPDDEIIQWLVGKLFKKP